MDEMIDQEVLKKSFEWGLSPTKKYGSFEFEVDYIEFT